MATARFTRLPGLPRASATASLVVLALGLSCSVQAQESKPLRAVVGLGGLYGTYLVNQSATKTDYPVPIVWAGVQYEQVGLQLGVARYTPGAATYGSQYLDYNLRRTRYLTGSQETRSWLFPLLLRYGLLPTAKRVQVEGIGGLLVVHNELRSSYKTTDSLGTVLTSYAGTLSLFESKLLLGAGFRCRLWAGLSVSAEAVTALQYQGYSVESLPLLLAGLRYQPGRRP